MKVKEHYLKEPEKYSRIFEVEQNYFASTFLLIKINIFLKQKVLFTLLTITIF